MLSHVDPDTNLEYSFALSGNFNQGAGAVPRFILAAAAGG